LQIGLAVGRKAVLFLYQDLCLGIANKNEIHTPVTEKGRLSGGRRIIASKDEEWYSDEELRIPQTEFFKVKRCGCEVKIWLDYWLRAFLGDSECA